MSFEATGSTVEQALCRDFVKKPEGCSFLMEIKRGGHCSFTSCRSAFRQDLLLEAA